jgi:hypothetical protein
MIVFSAIFSPMLTSNDLALFGDVTIYSLGGSLPELRTFFKDGHKPMYRSPGYPLFVREADKMATVDNLDLVGVPRTQSRNDVIPT